MGVNFDYENWARTMSSIEAKKYDYTHPSPLVRLPFRRFKGKYFYKNTQITVGEMKDAYDCLLLYPLKKYGHLLHSGNWADKKIDDYQTWAIETLIKSVETYDPHRGMKFSSFALLRARWWMIYKYGIQDQRENIERVLHIEMNLPRIDLSRLEAQVQEHILDLLSEEDRKFVELKYGLNGREVHTWKKMCKIYGKNYNFGLRIRMQKTIKKLQKIVDFDNFDV